MNEKIVLKNGKEYPLVIGGTSSTPRALQLMFQAEEPLEDIVTVFEAVYGRVAFLTLSQPGVEAAAEHNRADIDFLAVMTGTDL